MKRGGANSVHPLTGWTITTPLCLMDSGADARRMECFRLPFAAFDRTIRIATRREELGPLPAHLADLMRELMQATVLPQVRQLAPWVAAEFAILGDAGEIMPACASSLSGGES